MTVVLGATLLVIHTEEPMMLSAPMTVLPPRIVALAIDDHTVFDGGMTFVAADQLAIGIGLKSVSSQGHALIDLDSGADGAGLTDDDAGA